MFGKPKVYPYTQSLLDAHDTTVFVNGIMNDPRRFFAEAMENPQGALKAMALTMELAKHQLGQVAVMLSITGALKVAAKDKRAPEGAAKLAETLTAELNRAFKEAGI